MERTFHEAVKELTLRRDLTLDAANGKSRERLSRRARRVALVRAGTLDEVLKVLGHVDGTVTRC